MDREVVEVVARFGETVLGVAHLGPADTYRIGTAPGCDLAVPGLTCFPLVDGTAVRCPVGLDARHDGATTELRVGAIAICITRTQLPRAVVPAPRFELRTPLFVLASLIVHLAVWLAAERFSPLERVREPVRVRLARIAEPPVPPPAPPPAKQPPPRQQASGDTAQPGRRTRVARTREQAPRDLGAVMASVAKSFDDTHVVERLAELTADGHYDEDAANAEGFGGGRRFDPTQRDGWGTVETGPYATITFDFKQCPKGTPCEVVGPIPALYVRTHLLAHMAAIYDCYQAYASGPGTIVLEFTITDDGAVRDARGSGLGETGACAARVAGEIFFKALGGETRVRWPIVFKS